MKRRRALNESIPKWTLDSLVSDVVREEYTKKNKERFIEQNLTLLKQNEIESLRDWSEVSKAHKFRFSLMLVMLLDETCLALNVQHKQDTPIGFTEELKRLLNGQDGKQKALKFLIQSEFPEEGQFLERLKQLRERFFAPHFPTFSQREVYKEELVSFAKGALKTFQNNQEKELTKQDGLVGCLMGGSGSGKSRAAREAINIISEQIPELDCFVFYWDFANGLRLSDLEMTETSFTDARSVFGYRIFMRAIGKNQLKWEGNLLYRSKIFDIDLVLSVLASYLNQIVKPNKTATLLVVADEYQVLYQRSPSGWKEPLCSLLQYSMNTEGPNVRLQRDKICVIPLVVGTLPKDMTQFQTTEYKALHFSLELFHLETVLELVKTHLTDEQYNKVTSTNQWKLFWYESGLVPRMLQYAVEAVKETFHSTDARIEEEFIEKMQSRLTEDLNQKKPFPFESADLNVRTLKELIFSGVPLHILSEDSPPQRTETGAIQRYHWFRKTKFSGDIYQTRNRRVLLPRHHLRQLLRELRCNELLNYLPRLESNFTWRSLKILDLEALRARLNLYCREKYESIPLEWIFPGTMISESLRNIQLRLPQLPHHGTNDFIMLKRVGTPCDTTLVRNGREEVKQNIVWCYEGTELIDARWTTTQNDTDRTKVMIVIQYKYTRNEKISDIEAEDWGKQVMEEVSPHYQNYLVIPVLISNSIASKEERPNSRTNSTPFVLLSRKTAAQYFSPNFLPFYLLVEEPHDQEIKHGK